MCIIDIVGTVTVILLRRVAQFGRALRSGRRGRKFESCRNDWLKALKTLGLWDLPSVFLCLKKAAGQQNSNRI